MSDRIEMRPCGPIRGTIRPPGSKSITNRALICAALARGHSVLRGALDSEDTRVMVQGLQALGIGVEPHWRKGTIEVTGCEGRIPADQADLFLANSGTSMRFLTALVALGRGRYRLDGVPRMRQRPIDHLLDALAQLGVEARSEAGNGCPPVVIMTQPEFRRVEGESRLEHRHRVHVAGNISSQFLSGLLMVLPYLGQSTELVVSGSLVSKPYVAMTLAVMRQFGVEVAHDRLQHFSVAGNRTYQAREYSVEPDASAASYFWAAAAITGGQVTVEGLGRGSLQGDVAFCRCLERMGCRVEYSDQLETPSITVEGGLLTGIDVDMNPISDTVQTLAAVALFAQGPTNIRGVGHIRHKETDRIAALATELRKLGAAVEERPDGLQIIPRQLHGAQIDTYDDHRMAMSLSLVGLRVPGVVIRNPGCTAKTYPRFFHDLKQLTQGSQHSPGG